MLVIGDEDTLAFGGPPGFAGLRLELGRKVERRHGRA